MDQPVKNPVSDTLLKPRIKKAWPGTPTHSGPCLFAVQRGPSLPAPPGGTLENKSCTGFQNTETPHSFWLYWHTPRRSKHGGQNTAYRGIIPCCVLRSMPLPSPGSGGRDPPHQAPQSASGLGVRWTRAVQEGQIPSRQCLLHLLRGTSGPPGR